MPRPPEFVNRNLDRATLLENFVMAEANYAHIRSCYTYLRDNEIARVHPNFPTVMEEIAALGAEARLAMEAAMAELLSGTAIDFDALFKG